MSARIFCDRCGQEAGHFWRNLKVDLTRGMYASVAARYSTPEHHSWHICDHCSCQLRRWLAYRHLVVVEPENKDKP